MEDNTALGKEAQKIVDSLAAFGNFTKGLLDGAMKDVPKEDQAKFKEQIEQAKEGFDKVDESIREAKDLINNLPK